MKCWCSGTLTDSFHLDYKQCVFCGTFVSKKTTPDNYYDFESYWHDKQVNEYNFPTIEQRAKDDFNNRIPFWWSFIKNFNINSVLEIGGARGGFLSHCKKKGIKDCLGIEITEETCEFARKTFELEMVCGKFPSVVIDRKFDLVCGFDVFEHLSDPFHSLQKMKFLSNKYIMLQIPCYRREGLSFPHFHGEEHLFIFTETSIQFLFKSCGIRVHSFVKGAFEQDITIIGELI